MIKGIKETALIDTAFDIVFENGKIFGVSNEGNKREIYVSPSMWTKDNKEITFSSIPISDKKLINALPAAYQDIRIGLL